MKQLGNQAFAAGIAAVLLLMASNALADEIQTFDLVATTASMPYGQPASFYDASGQIVIDTTTGVIDAIIPNACVALGISAVTADMHPSSWKNLGQQLPQALAEDRPINSRFYQGPWIAVKVERIEP